MILNHRRTAAVLCAAAAAAALPAVTVAQAQQTARIGLLDGLLGGGGLLPDLPVGDLTLVDGLVDQILGANPLLDELMVTDVVTDLLEGGLDVGAVVDLVAEALANAPVAGPVLADIVDAVVGDLLADGLDDPAQLQGLLVSLSGGALPTGTLLAPVTDLLDTLAANPALPAELTTLITTLSTAVRSAGTDPLSGDLLGQVSGVLAGLTSTANLPKPVKDALDGLLALFGPRPAVQPPTQQATAPPRAVPAPPTARPFVPQRFVATGAMRARVSRIQTDKARRTLRVTLKCPTAAVFGCLVQTRARVGGQNVGRTVTTVLKPNQSRAVRLKLPAARTRALTRRGGRVGARATTLLGQINPIASRTTTVRKAAARRR